MPEHPASAAQSTLSSIVPAASDAGHASRRPALEFDPADYLRFLEDCEWTDDQKREFIEALWQIIVGFVDLGFDLLPVQQVMDGTKTLEVDSSGVLASNNKQHILETAGAGLNQPVGAGRQDS